MHSKSIELFADPKTGRISAGPRRGEEQIHAGQSSEIEPVRATPFRPSKVIPATIARPPRKKTVRTVHHDKEGATAAGKIQFSLNREKNCFRATGSESKTPRQKDLCVATAE